MFMADVARYYEILELPPNADPAAIKQAYRRLVKDWHPDRFAGQPQAQQAAEERIKQINTAYAYLKAHPRLASRAVMADPIPSCPPLDSSPENLAQWYYQRGVARAKCEDYAGAIADFGHAISLQPYAQNSYKYRGLVYAIIGNDYKATADLRRAAQLRHQQTATSVSSRRASPKRRRLESAQTRPPWYCAHIFKHHQDVVSAIALSPDDRYLVSGSYDTTVRIWQLSTGRQFRILNGHTAPVYCVAISPDNRWLASGDEAGVIRLWNLQTGQPVRVLDHWFGRHHPAVLSLAFHPDRKRLVSGSADHTVRLWKLASGKVWRCHTKPRSPITGLVLNLNSTLLVSNMAKLCKIRQVMNGRVIESIRETQQVFALAFTPDGETLATGGSDGVIRLWTIENSELLQTYTGHTATVTALGYSGTGHWLVSGDDNGALRLWNAITGRGLWQLQEHSDRISAVVMSPNSQTLISASFDQTIRVWSRSPH